MKRNRIFFTVLVLLGTFVSAMNLSAQETNGDKILKAKSFLNKKAPRLEVGKWLTDVPDMEGKFVLIEFWGPSCGPCRASIPTLNEFSKKFKDKLVVMVFPPIKKRLYGR